MVLAIAVIFLLRIDLDSPTFGLEEGAAHQDSLDAPASTRNRVYESQKKDFSGQQW